MTPAPEPGLPYKLAVLVFISDPEGRQLLILRNKQPNQGNWSPIGGKLEMAIGESPFECAARETWEETGLEASPSDFHLFGMIAEKAYEGGAHWLLFLFRCTKSLSVLPPEISEGSFAFFSRDEIDALALPETDRKALWPIWDQYRNHFVSMSIDCASPGQPSVHIDQVTPPLK